ncbi:ST3A1 sulfotransferase, partial [Phainopepla nitens]|nr:ST3A1 sulfotransferase [Phainopepla nitens]
FRGSRPAQVIYTVRDPKDVLVSLFHFARIFRPYRDPGSLEEFMGKFLQGDGAGTFRGNLGPFPGDLG